MKKILALVLIIGLVLSGCSSSGLKDAKPTEMTEKFAADETFVVYLGLSYCGACKIFKSIITSVIDETGTTIYYVEYDKYQNDEQTQAELGALVEYLEQNESFPYTFPIIFVVKEGKIIDQFSLQQTDDEVKFRARLVKNGVIEE